MGYGLQPHLILGRYIAFHFVPKKDFPFSRLAPPSFSSTDLQLTNYLAYKAHSLTGTDDLN